MVSTTNDASGAGSTQIDKICNAFEKALKGGTPRLIEEDLSAVESGQRGALLIELLKLEVHYRKQNGETPEKRDYLSRFPAQKKALDAVFGTEGRPDLHESSHAAVDDLNPTLSYIVANGQGLISTIVDQNLDAAAVGAEEHPVLNDRYELQHEVGRGGMGHVYLGIDRRLKRPVAVKMIRADNWKAIAGNSQHEMMRGFEDEARLGASLLHPAIAIVYDYGFHQGTPFAVFEYVPGNTLRDVIRTQAPLSLEDVQDIVGRLAEALDYAHRKGIVHRDLKPENIRLDEHGQCKILDLGLAMEFRHVSDWHFAGTPAYASPEQASERPSDGRSDQYALALIVFEMLTGRRVFEAGDWRTLLKMHRESEPISAVELVPSIPLSVDSAIRKALKKDPNDRFGTCGEFALALGSSVKTLPSQQTQILRESSVREKFRSKYLRRWPFPTQPIPARLVLQPEKIWIANVERIEWWPLSSLKELKQQGRHLTIVFETSGAPCSRRFKFQGKQECSDWKKDLDQLGASPRPGEPVECEMPVLLKDHPDVAMQLFGTCEASTKWRIDAELAVRLQAAMQQANMVVDVVDEKVVSKGSSVRRITGSAARTLDSKGRQAVISARYISECQEAGKHLFLFIILLYFVHIKNGRFRIPSFLSIRYDHLKAIENIWFDSGSVGAFLISHAFLTTIYVIPLIFVGVLTLTNWPQLLRPTAFSAIVMSAVSALDYCRSFFLLLFFNWSRPDVWVRHVLVTLVVTISLTVVVIKISIDLLDEFRKRFHTIGASPDDTSSSRRFTNISAWGIGLLYAVAVFGLEAFAVCATYETVALTKVDPEAKSKQTSVTKQTGRLKEAKDADRKAIDINSKKATDHNNLGNLLRRMGRLKEAEDAYRNAIDIDPQYAPAHCNLGVMLLRDTDRFAEAVYWLERGHELGTKSGNWRYPSGPFLREAREKWERSKRVPDSSKTADSQKPAIAEKPDKHL
jgi:serine/threonine protein kinase